MQNNPPFYCSRGKRGDKLAHCSGKVLRHNCFVPFWKVSWSHCIILCLCLLEFWILNSFAIIIDLCIGVKRFQLKCNYCRWNENRRAGIWVDCIVRYHPDLWVNILEGDPWDDMVLMSFSKCVLAVWVAQIPSVK